MTELDSLAQYYWSGYLNSKFEQELLERNSTLLKIPKQIKQPTKVAYILGCGSSINQVTEQQWQHISTQFSVGVNNFYVHDFTPNEYFIEFVDNQAFLNLIYDELLDNPCHQSAQVNLAGIYILLHGAAYRPPKIQKPKFYVSRSVMLSSKQLLKRILPRYFKKDNPFLTHHISNLDTVIHYCIKLGYKDINLVGVDLSNDGYFWDHVDKPAYLKARHFIHSFQKQKEYKQDSKGFHATASSEVARKLGKLTIVEYLALLQEHVLNQLGVKIWVTNPHSLLASALPIKEI
ncbi:hypothetical protein [Paraglaciecola sp. 25GB23A]|uniref:hypothetical protein n=1 Tax=Paraglaciecola sp. 25GB23A TaxID=3156068 RepID=UPI0032AFDA0F